MVPQRVEAVGSGADGLMQSSKLQVRRAIWEMSSSERRGNKAEREERREQRVLAGWYRKGSAPRREEGREQREERRDRQALSR